MKKITVVFGKSDTLEQRKAALQKELDCYCAEHGYVFHSAFLNKKDHQDIDDFDNANVMYADGCTLTFIQTTEVGRH